MSAKYAKDTLS